MKTPAAPANARRASSSQWLTSSCALSAAKSAMRRDDVGKSLRGTGITQKEFELRGWTKEESKVVHRVPIPRAI